MNDPARGERLFSDSDPELSEFGVALPDDRWMQRVRECVQPVRLGTLGPYELLDEVARGAQGIVYRARDTRSGRIVALKRLTAGRFATPHQQRRFERELEATMGLRHPNIVTIHEYDVIDGHPTLVMEWIDGVTIDRWARPRAEGVRRSLAELLAAFRSICDAVQHAHQRGVIHRDLKPGNILIDSDGRPHILDFGIAVLKSDDSAGARFTATSEFVGTPAYAAPEQVRAERDAVDVRTDVYALGVLLFELLTGHLPFSDCDGLAALFDAIRSRQPQPPSGLADDISADLDAIVLKALAKDRDQRYRSVDALATDLRRLETGEPIDARRAHRGYVLRVFMRRHRVALSVAVLVLTLLAGWAVTLSVLYARQARLLADVTDARQESERVQTVLQHLLMSVSEIGKGAQLELRREVLDKAAQAAEKDLRDSPAAWATAQDAIGRTYQQLGLYDEAERRLRDALQARIARFGRENADVATSLTHLASVLQDRARGAEAEPLFREALELRRRLLGSEHPQVAESLYDLAMVLQFRAEYAAAADVHRQALDLQSRLLGPEHPDIAQSLTGLGCAYANLRDYATAESWFRQSLELRLRLFGDEHRDAACGRVDLGKVLYELGRLDEAERELRTALATFRRLQGSEHDNTAWAAHRLGVVLTARGRYDEAESLLNEALDTYRRTLGPDTAYTGFVLESLADLQIKTGPMAAARATLKDAERVLSARPHQELVVRRIQSRIAELDRSAASAQPHSD